MTPSILFALGAFCAGLVLGVVLTVAAYYHLSTSRAWWP